MLSLVHTYYITSTVIIILFNITLDDYEDLSPPATLTFSNTQLVQCVDITIVDDNIAELTEVFSVVLSTNDTQIIVSYSTAEIFITDNDGEYMTV